MSQQTTVNVRMDADLKRELDKVCNDLGLLLMEFCIQYGMRNSLTL